MDTDIVPLDSGKIQQIAPFLFAIFAVLVTFISYGKHGEQPYPGIRMVGIEPGETLGSKTKARFIREGVQIMRNGFEELKGRVFQVSWSGGPLIVLPYSCVDEIRNDKRVSFTGFVEHGFFPWVPGMNAWRGFKTGIFQQMVRKNLTASIGSLTPEMSHEMSLAMNEMLPSEEALVQNHESQGQLYWSEVKFTRLSLQLVARVTQRVFVGERLCRNPEWLDVSIKYTTDAFVAAAALRAWPSILRPVVHWFLPEFRTLRAEFQRARRIVDPEVCSRRCERENAKSKDKAEERPKDSLSWFDDVAGERKFDVTEGQMLLSFVSIHTTATTLLALMYDLLEHSQYIDLLREEMVAVLKTEGVLAKTSLQKLKLLDSFMKESQRVTPISAFSMERRVEEPFTLSDGTYLPKGAIVAVPTFHMTHSFPIPAPTEFDGHRFLRMREMPGQENRWQYVTTSAEHIGFGHGKHACLGRFLASNELKIIMVHLLLKYDWKLIGMRPRSCSEQDYAPDANAVILCRPRKAEIPL